LLFVATVVMAG